MTEEMESWGHTMTTNEELVLEIQAGKNKQENIAMLYNQNRGLISKNASLLSGSSREVEKEDLEQEGYFGLIKAAELWQPDKGAKFSTYARQWIRQVMIRYIQNNDSDVRIPGHQRERIRKYKRVVDDFRKCFSRDPTPGELAAALDLSPDQVENVRRDAELLQLRSLDESLGDETNNFTLADTVPDPEDQMGATTDRIQNDQLAALLESIFDELPEERAIVLRRRYLEGRTQREIAEERGRSVSWIRQVEKMAIRDLQRPKTARKLLPYIEDLRETLAFQHTGVTYFRNHFTSSPERAAIRLNDPRDGE